VFSQPQDVQERIIPLAADIKALVELQDTNGGVLPKGELKKAAARLREHKNGVLYHMNQFRTYHAHYPGRDPAEAFSPPIKPGRPRGRDVPPDVTTFMKRAWKNRTWQSLNYDRTTSAIDRAISARTILAGVQHVFPEYKDQINLADVYHALEDLEKDETEYVAFARRGKKAIEDNLPTMNSTIEGVNEQWQSDIRPLPIFVRYGDIICTIRILYMIDQATKYILLGKLVPGKVERDGEYIISDNLMAREFRELFAMTMIRHKARPRMLYPDNGIQYRASTLGPYMVYTAAPGEPPTLLVNSRPRRPRGRGRVEGHLGDLDRYLQTRPGFFDEDGQEGEHGYRAVYAKIKRGIVKPRTFDELTKDLEGHIEYCNTNTDDGKSRLDLWQTGVDKSLSVPPIESLFVFAKTMKRKEVMVQRYGIDYDNDIWEPERDTEALRELQLRAALSKEKRQMPLVELGKEQLLYVNLAGDGKTWEPFVRKGKPRASIQMHNARNDAVQRRIVEANRKAESELDAFILERLGQPLVIDGSRQRLVPGEATQAPALKDSTSKELSQEVVTADDNAQPAPHMTPLPMTSGPAMRRKRSKRRDPISEKAAGLETKTPQASNAPDTVCANASGLTVSSDVDDDWSDFQGFQPKRAR
jgi:hypothetical protein